MLINCFFADKAITRNFRTSPETKLRTIDGDAVPTYPEDCFIHMQRPNLVCHRVCKKQGASVNLYTLMGAFAWLLPTCTSYFGGYVQNILGVYLKSGKLQMCCRKTAESYGVLRLFIVTPTFVIYKPMQSWCSVVAKRLSCESSSP